MIEPPISFDGPKWFCVVVEPGWHDKAEANLAGRGFRSFVPKVRKWVSHARVRKAVERPLLGRYLFVEVDHPRQSFADLAALHGVESIISLQGVPCVMPRAGVEKLFSRYLSGEFDEVANGPIPVGARVVMVEGEFNNLLATVTGQGKGGRLSLQLLGQTKRLEKVPRQSIAPAAGSDLRRTNDTAPA